MRAVFVIALLAVSGCRDQLPPRSWPPLTELGRDCTSPDAGPCAPGLECMKGGYFAGGPPYTTCELACDPHRDDAWNCPPQFDCGLTSDGPGHGRWRCIEGLTTR